MTSEQIHIGNMSHETAIGILKLMLEAMETYDGISPTPARINAFKMAIEALEQEPTTKIVLPSYPTNGDVISALFPNEGDFETDFDESWWNAPYKGDK